MHLPLNKTSRAHHWLAGWPVYAHMCAWCRRAAAILVRHTATDGGGDDDGDDGAEVFNLFAFARTEYKFFSAASAISLSVSPSNKQQGTSRAAHIEIFAKYHKATQRRLTRTIKTTTFSIYPRVPILNFDEKTAKRRYLSLSLDPPTARQRLPR